MMALTAALSAQAPGKATSSENPAASAERIHRQAIIVDTQDLKNILGGNILRLMERVDQVGREIRAAGRDRQEGPSCLSSLSRRSRLLFDSRPLRIGHRHH